MLALLLLLSLPKVDPRLQDAWCRGVAAWGRVPSIQAVRWCDSCRACKTGGGMEADRIIDICGPMLEEIQGGVDMTLWHEMGHAFGLDHVDRKERLSIMNPGWDWPYGEQVTEEDRKSLAR